MSRYRKNKNKNSSSINLFSFQDIISCVTGIMLCVTLLLIINLVNSDFSDKITKKKKEKIETIKKKDLTVIKKLQDSLKILKYDVHKLQKSIASIDVIPVDIKHISENEIRRRLKTFNAEYEPQKKMKVKLNKKLKSFIIINSKLAEKLEEVARGESIFDEKLRKSESLILKYKTNIGNKESLLNKLQSTPLEVSAETTVDGLKPVIIILSKNGIDLNFSDGRKKLFYPKMGVINFAIDDFKEYIKNNKKDKVYFYFMIKPSGVNYFSTLQDIIGEYNFKYGAEPVEERRVIVYK